MTLRGFPEAQIVKNLPVMQETRVRSLDWEVPLEKGMAIHSSILAWKISWTEEPGGLQSMGFSRQEYWSGVPLPSLPKYSLEGLMLKLKLQYFGHLM